MKKQYMIYGSVEDERLNNLSIFFIGGLAEAKRVYNKLERLNDLYCPTSDNLKREREALIKDLENNHSVRIWASEDDEAGFYFDIHLINAEDLK